VEGVIETSSYILLGDPTYPRIQAVDTHLYLGTTGASSTKFYSNNAAGTTLVEIASDGGIFMYELATSGDVDAVCMTSGEELTKEADSTCDSSSIKVKEDVENLTHGLDTVMQMRPITFRYKKDFKPTFQLERTGFIAEEMAEVVPEVITYEDYNNETGLAEGPIDGIDYNKLTAVLTKAIQEQQEQIEELSARIEELES
jgi:hypothetical protein